MNGEKNLQKCCYDHHISCGQMLQMMGFVQCTCVYYNNNYNIKKKDVVVIPQKIKNPQIKQNNRGFGYLSYSV